MLPSMRIISRDIAQTVPSCPFCGARGRTGPVSQGMWDWLPELQLWHEMPLYPRSFSLVSSAGQECVLVASTELSPAGIQQPGLMSVGSDSQKLSGAQCGCSFSEDVSCIADIISTIPWCALTVYRTCPGILRQPLYRSFYSQVEWDTHSAKPRSCEHCWALWCSWWCQDRPAASGCAVIILIEQI